MKNINKNKFLELAKIHQAHCVSVYFSTEGFKTPDKDQIQLKNSLKEAKKQLIDYDLQEAEIDSILKPAGNLLEDAEFWRGVSRGLALFLYDGKMEFFISETAFKEFVYVADHLYLKPLVTFLEGNNRFYLMTLSAKRVRIFEGNRDSINELETGNDLPKKLEEVVGEDYRQQSLQFRSGQGEGGEAIYHGHGAGGDTEKKKELKKFFQEIDRVLMDSIGSKNRPLVIACVDYLFPIYQEVNNYKHLVERPVPGNHDDTNPKELQKKVLELLEGSIEKGREQNTARYHEMLNKKLSSYKAEQIIPAAFHGRVETLFVDNDGFLWGHYDPERHLVTFRDQQSPGNVDLLNFAAIHTILNDGRVYLNKTLEMPAEEELLNAIFRYANGS